jgi:hypothetical protein
MKSVAKKRPKKKSAKKPRPMGGPDTKLPLVRVDAQMMIHDLGVAVDSVLDADACGDDSDRALNVLHALQRIRHVRSQLNARLRLTDGVS